MISPDSPMFTSNAPKGVGSVGVKYNIQTEFYTVEVEKYNFEKALYTLKHEQYGNAVCFITDSETINDLFIIREDGSLNLHGRSVVELLSFSTDENGNQVLTMYYMPHRSLTVKEETERPIAGTPFATITIIKHPTD